MTLSATRTAAALMLAALAALAGCGGPQPEPARRPLAGDDGRPLRTGDEPSVPIRRADAPPRTDPKPESGGGGILGKIGSALFGGGDTKTVSDTGPIQGEHTIRLQIFTAPGHEKRAAAWVNTNLVRAKLNDGFVVNQGDQSIVCYGRYPPPRTVGGKLELPADMVQDRAALIKRLAEPDPDGFGGGGIGGGGSLSGAARAVGGVRFDYVPTPVACESNACRIEDARGEWTLYWMSIYGEADSKAKAQQVAEEIRRSMKLPCFVVRNDQQYMVCVGDLPADALEQRAYAPVNAPRKLDGTAMAPRGEEFRNYIARPKSEEAQAIWDRFHDFLVNGHTPPVPAAFRDRTGKNMEPQSQWIRISELRGRRGVTGMTVDEESFLPAANPRR